MDSGRDFSRRTASGGDSKCGDLLQLESSGAVIHRAVRRSARRSVPVASETACAGSDALAAQRSAAVANKARIGAGVRFENMVGLGVLGRGAAEAPLARGVSATRACDYNDARPSWK